MQRGGVQGSREVLWGQVAVPTSMERDIRHPLVETTIGFDTATRVLSGEPIHAACLPS